MEGVAVMESVVYWTRCWENLWKCKSRNERVGETGDPRVNPPTSGIVQHDSHIHTNVQESKPNSIAPSVVRNINDTLAASIATISAPATARCSNVEVDRWLEEQEVVYFRKTTSINLCRRADLTYPSLGGRQSREIRSPRRGGSSARDDWPVEALEGKRAAPPNSPRRLDNGSCRGDSWCGSTGGGGDRWRGTRYSVLEALYKLSLSAVGFSHVGIVEDDDVGRRVFSGISLSPHPLIPTLLYTHLIALIGS
ncbi:hypothetical protein PR048_018361 [Dryococelus australis]|uniref:Uncharacterized protein n=1 Tax=Dryococelus australis TaxID=614101 RepID=A0ABQ9HCA1_9NEOP|nr:hypothetical protein PR048_018361 [Dryococelus australis]